MSTKPTSGADADFSGFFSSKIAKKPQSSYTLKFLKSRRRVKTGVLLLHWGEPRNLAQASKFYEELLGQYYLCGRRLSKFFTRFYLKLSGEVILNKKLFEPAKQRQLPSVYDSHTAQGAKLQRTLEYLMPEIGPVKCYVGHLTSEESSIEKAAWKIQEDSPENVIIFPQYPHYWCFHSGNCINFLCQILKFHSVPTATDAETKEPQDDDNGVVREDQEGDGVVLRQLVGNPKAYEVTPPIRWSLIDRWPTHPALTDAWVKLIEEEVNNLPEDVRNNVALLFCAPNLRWYNSTEYKSEVGACCSRILEGLGNIYPYRIAWFTGWTQWPVSIFGGISSNISLLLRDLVHQGWKNILLVPLTHTVPCLDTELVIKKHLNEKKLKKIGADHVKMLGPPGTHPTFIHGLAEIVKNHWMNGQPVVSSSQFALRCPFCFFPSCKESRNIFVLPRSSGDSKVV